MTAPFTHVSVLLDEVIAWLAPAPGALVLDATVGGGGHAAAILAQILPGGHLWGLDQDPAALEAAKARLDAVAPGHSTLIRSNFADLHTHGLPPLDAILLDIGVSSPQLDTPARGFSFQAEGPLDMRMDPDAPLTAADIVNGWPETEIARVLYAYGEERHSRRLARAIVARREEAGPFNTTSELADFIRARLPRDPSGIHPATRSFQGLRIAVNAELAVLETALPRAVALLKPGGRLGVISFHSLEDRLVKHFFRTEAAPCVCPPRQPVCTCTKEARLEVLTPKPVTAGAAELNCNPRARSAKLRVARRRPAPTHA